MNNMNKKQRIRVYRILVTLVLFLLLEILSRTGVFSGIPGAVIFLLYFVPYLIIGYDVIIRAAKNIIHGQIFDENFLMMLATFASFGLGFFGSAQYDEALAVMLFYQVGEAFQDYAVGKSRKSISQMMDIAPESANLFKDGEVTEVDPDDVHVDDLILIRPGEKVPLDGIVIEGSSSMNTAALTGESVPRRAGSGDSVISGTINGEGTLKVRVTKEYEDSTVAKILDLVENASSSKARFEKFITRFARVYTPIVTIGAVLLAVLLPLVFHTSWASGIYRACNFLIVSCPCALVISVPLGYFGGIGAASRIGVLVKGSNYLELASNLSCVVMDKTGTLTRGEFRVQKMLPAPGFDEKLLLRLAAAGESISTHPIAKSVLEKAREEGLNSAGTSAAAVTNGSSEGSVDSSGRSKSPLGQISDSQEIAGRGVRALLDGKLLLVGNAKLLQDEKIPFSPSAEHGTLVYIAYDGKFAGTLVIRDRLKEGAAEAVREMKKAGVRRTVMLTGDRQKEAEAVAAAVGIDEVHAQLLPQDKVSEVERILNSSPNGRTAFIGDGINDAPVLMRADVGFAMGAMGSDAAIEAADIVLMDDDIRKIPKVIRIARRTNTIVKSNVSFAIAVKLLILALSAFGLASMWAAVFADVGVAVLCILNSMRALNAK